MMLGMIIRKGISLLTLVAFVCTSVPSSFAQTLSLPLPGTMVSLSAKYQPAVLQGMKVYSENPFQFDFILNPGQETRSQDALKDESNKLIRYFLASLTISEKDLWVNLSPYEKDRIITSEFGKTEMGRDLLSQDYLLKQITASVIYPEGEVGKKFWREVYAKAQEKFGTTDIPVDTFNKVWIMPDKAMVYERGETSDVKRQTSNGSAVAYIVESRLKVMLETDYLSQTRAKSQEARELDAVVPSAADSSLVSRLSSQDSQELAKSVLREVIIPILEKEVNEGQNFAPLRQVYQSLILAAWFKKKIKESILSQVYVDQNKVSGVEINDPKMSDRIWAQYVEAFKKGAYSYVKEEQDPLTQEVLPRKYFSGGVTFKIPELAMTSLVPDEPSFAMMIERIQVNPVGALEPVMNIEAPQVQKTVWDIDTDNPDQVQNLYGEVFGRTGKQPFAVKAFINDLKVLKIVNPGRKVPKSVLYLASGSDIMAPVLAAGASEVVMAGNHTFDSKIFLARLAEGRKPSIANSLANRGWFYSPEMQSTRFYEGILEQCEVLNIPKEDIEAGTSPDGLEFLRIKKQWPGSAEKQTTTFYFVRVMDLMKSEDFPLALDDMTKKRKFDVLMMKAGVDLAGNFVKWLPLLASRVVSGGDIVLDTVNNYPKRSYDPMPVLQQYGVSVGESVKVDTSEDYGVFDTVISRGSDEEPAMASLKKKLLEAPALKPSELVDGLVSGKVIALKDMLPGLTAVEYEELLTDLRKKTPGTFSRRHMESGFLLINPSGDVEGHVGVEVSGPTRAYLRELWTSPRGENRGSHLMGAVLEEFKRKGVQVIHWNSNVIADGFYHRFLTPRVDYRTWSDHIFEIYLDTWGQVAKTPSARDTQLLYLKTILEREEAARQAFLQMEEKGGDFVLRNWDGWGHKLNIHFEKTTGKWQIPKEENDLDDYVWANISSYGERDWLVAEASYLDGSDIHQAGVAGQEFLKAKRLALKTRSMSESAMKVSTVFNLGVLTVFVYFYVPALKNRVMEYNRAIGGSPAVLIQSGVAAAGKAQENAVSVDILAYGSPSTNDRQELGRILHVLENDQEILKVAGSKDVPLIEQLEKLVREYKEALVKAERAMAGQKAESAMMTPEEFSEQDIADIARQIVVEKDFFKTEEIYLRLQKMPNAQRVELLRAILAVPEALWGKLRLGKRFFTRFLSEMFEDGFFDALQDPGHAHLLVMALQHPSYDVSLWASKELISHLDTYNRSGYLKERRGDFHALFDGWRANEAMFHDGAINIALALLALEGQGTGIRVQSVQDFIRERYLAPIVDLGPYQRRWLEANQEEFVQGLDRQRDRLYGVKKGMKALREIDHALKEHNAVAVLLGSTAFSLLNLNTTEEELRKRSDIDVIVLRQGSLDENSVEGFDLFFPRETDEAGMIWGNSLGGTVKMKFSHDVAGLSACLYIPSRETMVNLIETTAAAVLRSIDPDAFDDVYTEGIQKAFLRKIDGDLSGLSKLWTDNFGGQAQVIKDLQIKSFSREELEVLSFYDPDSEMPLGKYEEILNGMIQRGPLGMASVRRDVPVELAMAPSMPGGKLKTAWLVFDSVRDLLVKNVRFVTEGAVVVIGPGNVPQELTWIRNWMGSDVLGIEREQDRVAKAQKYIARENVNAKARLTLRQGELKDLGSILADQQGNRQKFRFLYAGNITFNVPLGRDEALAIRNNLIRGGVAFVSAELSKEFRQVFQDEVASGRGRFVALMDRHTMVFQNTVESAMTVGSEFSVENLWNDPAVLEARQDIEQNGALHIFDPGTIAYARLLSIKSIRDNRASALHPDNVYGVWELSTEDPESVWIDTASRATAEKLLAETADAEVREILRQALLGKYMRLGILNDYRRIPVYRHANGSLWIPKRLQSVEQRNRMQRAVEAASPGVVPVAVPSQVAESGKDVFYELYLDGYEQLGRYGAEYAIIINHLPEFWAWMKSMPGWVNDWNFGNIMIRLEKGRLKDIKGVDLEFLERDEAEPPAVERMFLKYFGTYLRPAGYELKGGNLLKAEPAMKTASAPFKSIKTVNVVVDGVTNQGDLKEGLIVAQRLRAQNRDQKDFRIRMVVHRGWERLPILVPGFDVSKSEQTLEGITFLDFKFQKHAIQDSQADVNIYAGYINTRDFADLAPDFSGTTQLMTPRARVNIFIGEYGSFAEIVEKVRDRAWTPGVFKGNRGRTPEEDQLTDTNGNRIIFLPSGFKDGQDKRMMGLYLDPEALKREYTREGIIQEVDPQGFLPREDILNKERQWCSVYSSFKADFSNTYLDVLQYAQEHDAAFQKKPKVVFMTFKDSIQNDVEIAGRGFRYVDLVNRTDTGRDGKWGKDVIVVRVPHGPYLQGISALSDVVGVTGDMSLTEALAREKKILYEQPDSHKQFVMGDLRLQISAALGPQGLGLKEEYRDMVLPQIPYVFRKTDPQHWETKFLRPLARIFTDPEAGKIFKKLSEHLVKDNDIVERAVETMFAFESVVEERRQKEPKVDLKRASERIVDSFGNLEQSKLFINGRDRRSWNRYRFDVEKEETAEGIKIRGVLTLDRKTVNDQESPHSASPGITAFTALVTMGRITKLAFPLTAEDFSGEDLVVDDAKLETANNDIEKAIFEAIPADTKISYAGNKRAPLTIRHTFGNLDMERTLSERAMKVTDNTTPVEPPMIARQDKQRELALLGDFFEKAIPEDLKGNFKTFFAEDKVVHQGDAILNAMEPSASDLAEIFYDEFFERAKLKKRTFTDHLNYLMSEAGRDEYLAFQMQIRHMWTHKTDRGSNLEMTQFFRGEKSWEVNEFFKDDDYLYKKYKSGDLNIRTRHVSASEGHEPYSVAILIYKNLADLYGRLEAEGEILPSKEEWIKKWDVEIHAYDFLVSNLMLMKRGYFHQFRVDKSTLKPEDRVFFEQVDAGSQYYEVRGKRGAVLREWVKPHYLDLTSNMVEMIDKYNCDMTFSRETLLYLGHPRVVSIMGQLLNPKGWNKKGKHLFVLSNTSGELTVHYLENGEYQISDRMRALSQESIESIAKASERRDFGKYDFFSLLSLSLIASDERVDSVIGVLNKGIGGDLGMRWSGNVSAGDVKRALVLIDEQRKWVITEVRKDRAAPKLKSSDKTGGIDFNTERMNLQTTGSGAGIKFRIDPATLQQWENASGASAVIISIQPLNSLKAFLGANVEEPSLVSG